MSKAFIYPMYTFLLVESFFGFYSFVLRQLFVDKFDYLNERKKNTLCEKQDEQMKKRNVFKMHCFYWSWNNIVVEQPRTIVSSIQTKGKKRKR